MQNSRTLLATWLAMLGIQTVGSVDAKHRLPAPKQYVAIGTLWGILFLVADMGYAKLAARLSLLVLLTASVVGPFGRRAISFLTAVAKNFAIPPSQDEGVPPAGPAASVGPIEIRPA